jgi:outer membrane protein OmpA-like peptidoglycan-associated protein
VGIPRASFSGVDGPMRWWWIAVAMAIGCGGNARQYRERPVGTTKTTAAVITTPGDYAPASVALYVSALEDQTCGMARIPPVAFPDDKLRLGPVQELLMRTLATCFTSGPLADRTIILIGEANPTGDAAYNLNLGAVHAAMIKDLLVANGVPPARVLTSASTERCTGGAVPGQDRVEIVISR